MCGTLQARRQGRRTNRRFAQDQSGATAVEFAFLAPVLIFILMGITGYGGYFWMSHSVQQLANDAARAAISGTTAAERASLAKSVVAASAGDAQLIPAKVTTDVVERDGRLTVAVSYDATQSFAYAVRGITPMPPEQIRRKAAVQLGGY